MRDGCSCPMIWRMLEDLELPQKNQNTIGCCEHDIIDLTLGTCCMDLCSIRFPLNLRADFTVFLVWSFVRSLNFHLANVFCMFIVVLGTRTYQLRARYFAGNNHQRLFNTQWPDLCSRDAEWRSHNTQYFLSGQSSCDTCRWAQHSNFKREIGKEAVSRNWEGRL